MSECEKIYNHSAHVMAKFPDLRWRLVHGTVVPDQVEIHLPPRGKARCWLKCPHCFDCGAMRVIFERISRRRLLQVIREIGCGHPQTGEVPEKIIVSGFDTDPLNSAHIEAVVAEVKRQGFVLGVHTKGLRVSNRLVGLLTHTNRPGDYVTFGVDSGSDEVFNIVHGVPERSARLFSKVKKNIQRLVEAKQAAGSTLSVVATYLITSANSSPEEVQRFARTMLSLGVDHIRVSQPMEPVMGHRDRSRHTFPQATPEDARMVRDCVSALSAANPGRVCYLEHEPEVVRTLPCYLRWLQPTVGFDGWLYPCCLTACEEFSSLRLGDLKQSKFWDAYRAKAALDFVGANCQCDRKSAIINSDISEADASRRMDEEEDQDDGDGVAPEGFQSLVAKTICPTAGGIGR